MFVSIFSKAGPVTTALAMVSSMETNLHPVVELFGYTAWTWHRFFSFARRIKVETFLHVGRLAVQLIGNAGQQSSSFDAETKK